MAQTVEPVTLALTGMLPFGVIAGAVLAYPLGRGLLRVYHRSVARSMAQRAGSGERPDVPAAALFELGELLKTVDLRRVVFAIDATTDRGFLEESMARLWQTVPAESPNRRQPNAAARLVDLGIRTDAPALQRLFTALA